MPVETILVALALEDDGTRVADRAIQLASQHGAQLIGLHVTDHLSVPDTAHPASEGARRLQSLLAGTTKPAVTCIEAGKPHGVIQRMAVALGADLIIIGPGIARNVQEKIFGSTADRVVRSASCPVLVVRSDSPAPYRRIAVGADVSDHAIAAAFQATRLFPTAIRELVHAVKTPLAFKQAMLEAGTSRAEMERYRVAKSQTAREQVIAAYGESGRLPSGTRLGIVYGDPAAMLLSASRRGKVDLVAIGTQGLNAVAQRLLGRVARKVLGESACDVLAVPASHISGTD